jgi:hypothetical protein|tara:strand:- start:478 stop:720 length:243 start_codon:yes stop_codon:yes gene_type:complete
MTQQLNSAGIEETPLYIPFKAFDNKQSCMEFATHNSDTLFMKAWKEYKGQISPKMLNCVTEDIIESIGQTVGKKKNETDI